MYQPVSSLSLPSLRIEDCVNEERRELMENLRVRKEALQDALEKKLAELRALCLKEGELTGELPPEIPLGPREPVPQIRKRVRTEFQLDDKLLTIKRDEEEEALADLELEIEIQSKIVSATFKLCNEVNVKRAVRKQRKQAYEQAVVKLKDLEQKLCASRRNSGKSVSEIKIESKKTKEEDAMSNSTEASSGLSLVTDDENNTKSKAKEKSSRSSTSAPSTPVKLRDKSRVSPHITSFVPISPPNKRCYKNPGLRPSSELLPFAPDLPNIPQRCRTVDRMCRSPEYDRISISSGGTSASIPRVPHTRRMRTQDVSSPLPPSGGSCNTVPTRRTSRHQKSQDDSIVKKEEPPSAAQPPTSSNDGSSAVLRRHNSLENTRRKSYIAATQPYPMSLSQQSSNHPNQHTFPKRDKPNSGGVSKMHGSINMAQRPLPPTPDQSQCQPSPPLSSASLAKKSKRASDNNNNNSATNNNITQRVISATPTPSAASTTGGSVPHVRHKSESRSGKHFENGTAPIKMTWKEADAAISCRPVRSTVVRTPFNLNISTTCSSDNMQYSNIRSPSPAPLLPPRTPTAPAGSVQPFSTVNANLNHSLAAQKKVWSETAIDDPPASRKHADLHVITDESATLSAQISPASVDEADALNQKCQSDTISLREVRRNMTTPRPISIPLSPTLPPVGSGVEVNVLSVGHFQPYWEETKPYELADFYKYSTKHRKKKDGGEAEDVPGEVKKPEERQCVPAPGLKQPNARCRDDEPKEAKNLNCTLNESFISKAAVSEAFHNEMFEWFEDEVKKATLV